MEEIIWGRVVVVRESAAPKVKQLRINPIGGVTFSKDKVRKILDLSFGKGGPMTDIWE